MSVLVTDAGFAPDDWLAGFLPAGAPVPDRPGREIAVELPADTALAALAGLASDFDRLALIRIPFASFADGRGFTLARQLRLLGYRGRLRASGEVIADQYAMARRSGFDEVEIDTAHARRQPETHWLAQVGGQSGDYQERLGVGMAGDRQAGHRPG